MAARATFALKAGLCVRRARLAIVTPDMRHSRRSQADFPLIGLSEFVQSPLCVHSFAHGRTVYELRHDAMTIEAALHTAAKGDVPDILERLILQANLEPEREHDLLKLAAKLGEVLITSLKTRLKFAKAAQKRRQVSDRREQRAATRKDTRIELLAPESDAERTPVLRSLDEVLCAVQDPEPPMRDIQGWPVEIRCRAPLMLHELIRFPEED